MKRVKFGLSRGSLIGWGVSDAWKAGRLLAWLLASSSKAVCKLIEGLELWRVVEAWRMGTEGTLGIFVGTFGPVV